MKNELFIVVVEVIKMSRQLNIYRFNLLISHNIINSSWSNVFLSLVNLVSHYTNFLIY